MPKKAKGWYYNPPKPKLDEFTKEKIMYVALMDNDTSGTGLEATAQKVRRIVK